MDFSYTAIPYRASTGTEQGFPCVVFPTGKTLFCPCTGPVRDCSVCKISVDLSFGRFVLIVYKRLFGRLKCYLGTLETNCQLLQIAKISKLEDI